MDQLTVGIKARTINRLDPTGEVDIDGKLYQAETSMFGGPPHRLPIGPDREVEVTGWRRDGRDRVILLVKDPANAIANEPDTSFSEQPSKPVLTSRPAPTLSLEERVRILEQMRETARGGSDLDSPGVTRPTGGAPGAFAWFLLTFGQFMSIVGCAAALIYPLIALPEVAQLRQRYPELPNPSLRIILFCALGFLYSAAMFVVFSTCKERYSD